MYSQLFPTTSALDVDLNLDDTYLIMSSSDFDSASILIRGILPTVNNNHAQQLSKSTIRDVPLGSDQEAGPSTRPTSGFNPPFTGNTLSQSVDHASDRQSTSHQSATGGAGGGDRSGNQSSGSTITSQEKTSGESTTTTTTTTTSSGSMPELVDPPLDPFTLLYPSLDISSSEELSKPTTKSQQSDESSISEASTAMVSDTDIQGRSIRRHYGLHVIDVNEKAHSEKLSVSTSSSSVAKVGEVNLDTTVSTLSPFTNTSMDKSKSSDSCDHLDTSREGMSEFRPSLDMFSNRGDFSVSTPTICKTITDAVDDSEGSEFLIPPSATGEDSYSMCTQSSSYVPYISNNPGIGNYGDSLASSSTSTLLKRSVSEEVVSSEQAVKPKRKRLELHLEPPIVSDLELVRPSRRAVADMAVTATRGEFLMKSIQKTNDEEGSSSITGPKSVISDPESFHEVLGEPSPKVMRKIVFESFTSSDESQFPSANIARESKGGGEASQLVAPTSIVPQLRSSETQETEELLPEANRLQLMMDSEEKISTIAKTIADDIVEDTEEDEVEEDLILRYSPSQTSQSQYYPLVPESDLTETEPENDQTKRNDQKNNLDVPSNQFQSLDQKQPPPLSTSSEKNIESAGIQTTTINECSSTDEDNPFDSVNILGEPSTKREIVDELNNKDEPDVPACPVGRQKRKNVWGDDYDELLDVTKTYLMKKQHKVLVKTFGCQVDMVGDDQEQTEIKTNSNGEEKIVNAESKAVQTTLSGDIKSIEDQERLDVDEADKASGESNSFRRTVIVKRTIIEEVLQDGKVINKNVFEEEDQPLVTEYTGHEVHESAIFARPTPPDKIKHSPAGSSSSKSASTNASLNKSMSSSSITSGIFGDVSSLSKSTTSSKHTSSDERPSSKSTGKTSDESRALRSVRRRKFFEVRKNLALCESSDSTPEPVKTSDTPPTKKQGRRKSRDRVSSKKKEADNTEDYVTPTTTKNVAKLSTTKHSDMESAPSLLTRPSSVRVMARWRDGFYYPGLLLEREKDDRMRVEYDDGDIRSIRSSDVLLVDIIPVGQSVYVQSPDSYYDSGIVVDHYEDIESGERGYVIETDGGMKRRVVRSRVILTGDQAACILTHAGTPPTIRPGTANISLDNLMEGKRRSGPQTPVTTEVHHSSPRTRRTVRKTSSTSAVSAANDVEPKQTASNEDS